jgi:hypothetical protein
MGFSRRKNELFTLATPFSTKNRDTKLPNCPIMLEYWHKEKRTRVDLRPDPLGPYFDRFAARLKDRRCSAGVAQEILGWT